MDSITLGTVAAVPVTLTNKPATPSQRWRVEMAQHFTKHADAMAEAVAAFDLMTPKEQRRMVAQLRLRFSELRPLVGLKANRTSLTQSAAGNIKVAKNVARTITYTGSPATSGRVTVDTLRGPVEIVANNCPHAGKCARVCVLSGGNARYDGVRDGRRWRDLVAVLDPVGWVVLRRAELIAAADKFGAVLERGDVGTEYGLADLVPQLYADTPKGNTVRGYDYGKRPQILRGDGWTADRHHRTVYSWNESSDARAVNRFLGRGGNVVMVAAIAKRDDVPAAVLIGSKWWPTIDGDKTDDRFNEAGGRVVIVRAKGKATEKKHAAHLGGFLQEIQYR